MSKIDNVVLELVEQGYNMEEITNGQVELGEVRLDISTTVTKADDNPNTN